MTWAIFHLQYKHSGTFANLPKMSEPILVTLLKMLPHSSQSSREIATQSSSTSPLASCKKVYPPGFWFVNVKQKTVKKKPNSWDCPVLDDE